MIGVEQALVQEVTLATLSPQAKRLVALLATDAVFLGEISSQFAHDKAAMWAIAQEKVGLLTTTDREVLENLAAVFLPGSSLAVYVTNSGDCGGGGECWL